MRIRVRLLETVVEIHTEEEQAGRLLSLLWAEMTTGDATVPVRTYEVARHDEHGWIATAGDDVEAVHESLWGLADALRFRMLELCEERLQGFVTLHAAAVARAGRLVLLAGESGAGKTTLTLALLEAGWTYLSDDLAPVSRDTVLVHPFPKPLGVKDPAAWESVRVSFPGWEGTAPAGSFLVPASRWEVATEPLPAAALLFPRYAAGATPVVELLSPAQAAAAASAYLRRLDPSTLGLLKRLCTGAVCARLTYGSSEEALSAIDDVTNRRE